MPVSVEVPKGNLAGCTMITGFHGVGETGYIAVSYLVNALAAARIGFVKVSHPPPFIATSEEGIVTPFEVYRRGRTVLVKQEFAPHRSEEAEFAKALAQWTVAKKFKEAILIGGLDSSLKSGRERIKIVPTQSFLSRRNGFKYPTLDPGLLISGQLALMLSEFEINRFPAVALLPYASTSQSDPSAAAVAVKSICKAYRLKIDVSDLERDAKDIEKELSRRLEQTKRSMHGMYG